MPPRLSKRQQREEVLSRLRDSLLAAGGDEPAEGEAERPRPQFIFGISELSSESESDAEEAPAQEKPKSKKSKKKKKKKKSAAPAADTPPRSANDQPSAPQPSKGKGKAGQKDDFDAALEELAQKYPDMRVASSSRTGSVSTVAQTFKELLAVSPKYLDSQAELRRFFGHKVVNSVAASSRKKPPSASHRNASVRSVLTHIPDAGVQLRSSQGLSVKQLDERTIRYKGYEAYAFLGEKWWTIEHDIQYKKMQMEFLGMVQVGDPNHFVTLLQINPWHVDTNLQLAEVFRHQEDYDKAGELVDRAMFAYERAFAGSFNFTLGTCRLDFDCVENRPFFLSLHRHIQHLERRGTTRTAFEVARLLLSLDPHTDPHGALLHLDFLAVKSGMDQWLLDMWNVWDLVKKEADFGPDDNDFRIELHCLPGWAYSRAVALRHLEIEKGDKEHSESTAALREAVLAFPYVVPVLADKAGISLPQEVRAHQMFRISTGWDSNTPAESALHLLSHIYAHRAALVWKDGELSSWFEKTVPTVLPSNRKSKSAPMRDLALRHFATGPTQAICRHVLVCEIRSLTSFLDPTKIPNMVLAYDPLPPLSSRSRYDEKYLEEVPWPSSARRAEVRPEPHVGQAEIAMQQLLFNEIRARVAQGAPPGAFHVDADEEAPIEDEDEGYEDDEVHDGGESQEPTHDEESVPAGRTLWQTLLNRILGDRGEGAAQDATEDQDQHPMDE
ncbi:hypothetical protein BOTBODRAFT_38551 [Botryobasidium botryosum FD-172 SS1]|uniref:DUF654-domain-containing protein n=1 Tax=Botryobasidium botryosum (strain FD-172 SS1) TaxID=930990 RepID=A0A067LX27_BOTB1|nr:hypothetical protein BOTBODRAFT_38551 [Botryobasidium botryosum FD-172 SS1]